MLKKSVKFSTFKPMDVSTLLERIAAMEQRTAELEAENQALREENAALKDCLAERSRNSANSDRPPSSDGLRKTQSLRKASGKKPGGQPGHKGHTLETTSSPDHVIEHRPEVCSGCGTTFRDAATVEKTERRQVYDLPESIKLEVTEHRAQQVVCPCCGVRNRAAFPEGVRGRTQYGPRIASLALSLHHEHSVSCHRTIQILNQLAGARFCAGTLANVTRRAGKVAAEDAPARQAALQDEAATCADETGLQVAGSIYWVHTWTSAATGCGAVDLQLSERRGAEGMKHLEACQGLLVHDGWKSYEKIEGAVHVLCNAHHLRELAFFKQKSENKWAGRLARLLVMAWHEVKAARAAGRQLPPETVSAYRKRAAETLKAGRAAHPPPTRKPGQRGRTPKSKELNFIERFEKGADAIWRFLTNPNAPFDNNAAERSIRMLKVGMKMRGCFRTADGARAHLALRSSMLTAKNQGANTPHIFKDIYRRHLLG